MRTRSSALSSKSPSAPCVSYLRQRWTVQWSWGQMMSRYIKINKRKRKRWIVWWPPWSQVTSRYIKCKCECVSVRACVRVCACVCIGIANIAPTGLAHDWNAWQCLTHILWIHGEQGKTEFVAILTYFIYKTFFCIGHDRVRGIENKQADRTSAAAGQFWTPQAAQILDPVLSRGRTTYLLRLSWRLWASAGTVNGFNLQKKVL